MPQQTPSLDMTPMVDLAFLLVTFFMLTASFRMQEPVVVDPPTSTTIREIPKQVFLITVNSEGQAFIDITHAAVKAKVFRSVCKQYDIKPTDEEVLKFTGAGSIGMSIENLRQYLSLDGNERTKVKQNGIPYDTTGKKGQLYWWAYYARLEAHKDFKQREEEAKNRKLDFDKDNYIQFAVKADANAKYDVVKHVIQVFRDAKVKQFQMITGLESKPKDK
ncbi:MAG: biopolymer transporter ExbD [Bacteroidetes bacterium]|nr:biopolymer transporter ExbD [Bacteroidota bacterium]